MDPIAAKITDAKEAFKKRYGIADYYTMPDDKRKREFPALKMNGIDKSMTTIAPDTLHFTYKGRPGKVDLPLNYVYDSETHFAGFLGFVVWSRLRQIHELDKHDMEDFERELKREKREIDELEIPQGCRRMVRWTPKPKMRQYKRGEIPVLVAEEPRYKDIEVLCPGCNGHKYCIGED